jgi:cobaltochelatase CobT
VPNHPAAFMSYAHADDKHDFGQLTQFRERLSGEVGVQTARDFPIFQDRESIEWGQNWRQRINDSLDTATFLLVFLTPNFFGSAECAKEVKRFLARERRIGRRDLILPVYYIPIPQLDDKNSPPTDPMIRTLAARQHFDWREYRFEPFSAPETRKAMATLATRIRDAL